MPNTKLIDMATEDEVKLFLSQFKIKLTIFHIVFVDREKNQNALMELGITSNMRLEIIKNLVVEDYSHTITDNLLYGYGEMWVFGKDLNEEEIYIKISLGKADKSTICISFHKAEQKMVYPYKK